MAKKSSNDTKTVTGTMKNGTKVTVSEDLAGRLGGFSADKSRSSSSSSSNS